MRYAYLIPVLALLALQGCDDRRIITPDTPQRVTGSWEGTTVIGQLEMVLAEEDGGIVTGSGFIREGLRHPFQPGFRQSFRQDFRLGFRTIAFDVTGANAFPDVSLSLHFRGDLAADTIVGTRLLNYTAEFDASGDRLSLFGRLNGGPLRDVVLRVERE